MSGKEDEIVKLLFEMIRGSRRSDRELAKALKISQPTITRKRTILEKAGFIREYTLIPNLEKVGFEFIAFSRLSFSENRPTLFEEATEWTQRQPSVIFAANGEGSGMNSIMVSVHSDYASFSRLITELRRDWQPNLRDIQTFIVSLSRPELIIKPFSLTYLAEKNVAGSKRSK